MAEVGFKRGEAPLCAPHGDDYVSVGQDGDLKWLKGVLGKKCGIKTQVLGPGRIRFLNRVLAWPDEGAEYEADPRHAEIVVQEIGLIEAKPVSTPGPEDEGATGSGSEMALERDQAPEYRALVARWDYLSHGRPDISLSVKELARTMSAPMGSCWGKLKRIAGHLVASPRLVIRFDSERCPTHQQKRSEPFHSLKVLAMMGRGVLGDAPAASNHKVRRGKCYRTRARTRQPQCEALGMQQKTHENAATSIVNA